MAHQMASAEASVCIPQAQRALNFKDSKVLKGVRVNGVSKTGTNFKFEVQLMTFFFPICRAKKYRVNPPMAALLWTHPTFKLIFQ